MIIIKKSLETIYESTSYITFLYDLSSSGLLSGRGQSHAGSRIPSAALSCGREVISDKNHGYIRSVGL